MNSFQQNFSWNKNIKNIKAHNFGCAILRPQDWDEILGPDFVSTFWRPIRRILTSFFHAIISEEWDLSHGEVWECVTNFRSTKRCQTRHTKFVNSKRNFDFGEMTILSKTYYFWKFCYRKIKIVTKLIKNNWNLINV